MPERRLKQFLATGPWQQITPYTITDPQVLTGELKRIREQDYAVNDSEFIVGVVGAAVPVRSEDDRVLAAVTVSAPKIRLTPDRVKDCIPAMGWTAARIARAF